MHTPVVRSGADGEGGAAGLYIAECSDLIDRSVAVTRFARFAHVGHLGILHKCVVGCGTGPWRGWLAVLQSSASGSHNVFSVNIPRKGLVMQGFEQGLIP